jgi:hypothetical protein
MHYVLYVNVILYIMWTGSIILAIHPHHTWLSDVGRETSSMTAGLGKTSFPEGAPTDWIVGGLMTWGGEGEVRIRDVS